MYHIFPEIDTGNLMGLSPYPFIAFTMLLGSLCSQHDLHHEGDDIAAGYAVSSETNQDLRVWGADPIKMPAADIYGCQGETCFRSYPVPAYLPDLRRESAPLILYPPVCLPVPGKKSGHRMAEKQPRNGQLVQTAAMLEPYSWLLHGYLYESFLFLQFHSESPGLCLCPRNRTVLFLELQVFPDSSPNLEYLNKLRQILTVSFPVDWRLPDQSYFLPQKSSYFHFQ